MRAAAIGLVVMVSTLPGCVAAVVPIVASGAVGTRLLVNRSQRRDAIPAPIKPPPVVAELAAARQVVLLPPGSVLPPPSSAPSASAASEEAVAVPPLWSAVVRYVAGQAISRPAESVVMIAGSSLAKPAWVPCGLKPFAAIVDVELVGDAAAQSSLDALRTMGITVVAMGGRPILGAQRTAIAARYCVIAVVGDQPGDFNDQFREGDPARRQADGPIDAPKNVGWFLDDRSTGASAATMVATHAPATNAATSPDPLTPNPLEGKPD